MNDMVWMSKYVVCPSKLRKDSGHDGVPETRSIENSPPDYCPFLLEHAVSQIC
jgi:hypothetical protein